LSQLSDENESIKKSVTIKYFDRSNPLLKPKLKKSRFYQMNQERLKKEKELESMRNLKNKRLVEVKNTSRLG
jgi:hypothetical protein